MRLTQDSIELDLSKVHNLRLGSAREPRDSFRLHHPAVCKPQQAHHVEIRLLAEATSSAGTKLSSGADALCGRDFSLGGLRVAADMRLLLPWKRTDVEPSMTNFAASHASIPSSSNSVTRELGRSPRVPIEKHGVQCSHNDSRLGLCIPCALCSYNISTASLHHTLLITSSTTSLQVFTLT